MRDYDSEDLVKAFLFIGFLFAVVLYFGYSYYACSQRGGVLVRSMVGYGCVAGK
jgi:hypothetical protein